MERILSKLYNSSPKEIFHYVWNRLRSSVPHAIGDNKVKEISDGLRKKLEFYQTTNLKGINPEEFTSSIQSKIGVIDSQTEGYSDFSSTVFCEKWPFGVRKPA